VTDTHHAHFLGPRLERWRPSDWAEIQPAIEGGLLDESHWVELKLQIPTTKGSNTGLARDLASLAVDGGTLIVGIEEDGLGRAVAATGTELKGLAERIDQIARSRIDEPLLIRTFPAIEHPDRPGIGCLVVEIPPSPLAPHQVDGVAYGRADRAKMRLSSRQVQETIQKRLLGQTDVTTALAELEEYDLVLAHMRVNGHLYVAAQPAIARLDMPFAATDNLGSLDDIVRTVSQTGGSADPLPGGSWRRNSDGVVASRGINLDGRINENSFSRLGVRDDGGIRLTYGRGTLSLTKSDATVMNNLPRPDRVIDAGRVTAVLMKTLTLAGRLTDRHSAYQGEWRVGVRLTRTRGIVAREFTQPENDLEDADPYEHEAYERTGSSHTQELVEQPAAVAKRLLTPLLRALAVD
jgi:hypothetical protein